MLAGVSGRERAREVGVNVYDECLGLLQEVDGQAVVREAVVGLHLQAQVVVVLVGLGADRHREREHHEAPRHRPIIPSWYSSCVQTAVLVDLFVKCRVAELAALHHRQVDFGPIAHQEVEALQREDSVLALQFHSELHALVIIRMSNRERGHHAQVVVDDQLRRRGVLALSDGE